MFPWYVQPSLRTVQSLYHTFLCQLWCNLTDKYTWHVRWSGIFRALQAYFIFKQLNVVQFRDHYIMLPANERWRYTVTPSFIGWVHTQNDSWWYSVPIININFFSSVHPLTNTLRDHWTIGPLSTGKITYCFTANDCVQSPAMESNHDTNYLSAGNMDWISEIDFNHN